MVLRPVRLDGAGEAIPTLLALRLALSSSLTGLAMEEKKPRISREMCSVFHHVVRPEKSAPKAKLFDPADLVHQLVHFVHVRPFIPHHSRLHFPAHLDSFWKPPN